MPETHQADSGLKRLSDFSERAIGEIARAYTGSTGGAGLLTGFEAMDYRCGGLSPSDLIVLAGRPSMGKTALALSIATNVAARLVADRDASGTEADTPAVAIFSLETSPEQIYARLLAAEARIGTDELRGGKLRDQDFKQVDGAIQSLASRPIFLDATPELTITDLRIRAKRLRDHHGLALIVVDYLQLLRSATSSERVDRVREVSEITKGLKALAKELRVPVLALSQLSRAIETREDKRPKLSDLRDSGSIEEDADVVMFIHREEYYLAQCEPRHRMGQSDEKFNEEYSNWTKRLEEAHGVADIIVAKHRNGPAQSFQMIFNAEYSQFLDIERPKSSTLSVVP